MRQWLRHVDTVARARRATKRFGNEFHEDIGCMAARYGDAMGIEKINPPDLAQPTGYSQVVVATGTRRVYVAGQTGVGADGAVVGQDLGAQTAQALRNVGIALDAGGATWADVAKMTILIVGYEPAMAGALFAGMSEVFGSDAPTPATTLHGVHSLFGPDLLVEIEAIAEF